MKRLLLLSTLTLLLVVFIGGSASAQSYNNCAACHGGPYTDPNMRASNARIMSLGGVDYYFKDINHIFTNPAYLGMYTNTVYGQIGIYHDPFWENYDANSDENFPVDQHIGVNYKVYKGLSLGLTLNRRVPSMFDYYMSDDGVAASKAQQPDGETFINQYDFLTSYDFEKLHVGLGFRHEGDKSEYKDDYETPYSMYTYQDKWSVGTTSLTGGVLYDLNEKSCLEGWVKLNFDRYDETYKYSDTTGYWYEEKWKSDGGNGIGFGARAFYEVVENFQVVPLIMFESEKASEKFDYSDLDTVYATQKSGDVKYSFLVIGLGGNLKLDKGMVAGGINLTREKWTDNWDTLNTEEFTTWFKPGFNLGVEYELTKWLTGRIGMEKEFMKFEDVSDYRSGGEGGYHYHYLDKWSGTTDDDDFLGLGVGFKFSKFKIDATVGDNRFFEGGYILSGRHRNVFGTMTATFQF